MRRSWLGSIVRRSPRLGSIWLGSIWLGECAPTLASSGLEAPGGAARREIQRGALAVGGIASGEDTISPEVR